MNRTQKKACLRFKIIIFQEIYNIYQKIWIILLPKVVQPCFHLKTSCIVNINNYIPDKAVKLVSSVASADWAWNKFMNGKQQTTSVLWWPKPHIVNICHFICQTISDLGCVVHHLQMWPIDGSDFFFKFLNSFCANIYSYVLSWLNNFIESAHWADSI